MHGKSLFLLTPMGILILLVVFAMASHNTLVDKDEQVREARTRVAVTLQRRADLIPSIVSASKVYVNTEDELFDVIDNARKKIGSSDKSTRIEGHKELESAISQFLIMKDAHPELKYDTDVKKLINELEGTESRLFVVRQDYNRVASSYNHMVRRFPISIIANLSGFKPVELIEFDDSLENRPKSD